jgi:RNA polymerase sigma-70 factor (ECF subfamily)
MAGAAPTGEDTFSVEEAGLAGGAAAGDGRAFAALYERYEQRVYNLAYRITGSEADAADATQEAFLRTMRLAKLQDGEADLAPFLFVATHHACHDLIEKRQPGQPDEAMPVDAQLDVAGANMRLPERQREALALLELGALSYEEIAASMEITADAVAKLAFRARINLSDELHGTALAAIAAPSPECERALPLIAAREDGQLEAGSDDDAWLDAHLAGCERCGLCVEAMHEAGASYRAWPLIAVLSWLFEETMAKAATLAGADWSGETRREGNGRPSRRRRAIAAAGLAALLLAGGIAAVLVGGEPANVADRPVAATHPARNQPSSKPRSKRQKERHGSRNSAGTDTTPRAATAASTPSPIEAAGGSSGGSGAAPAGHQAASGLQPQQATGAPKPKPTPSQTSQPASAPAPPAETQAPTTAPAEEPVREHPSQGRGPPAGVPGKGP